MYLNEEGPGELPELSRANGSTGLNQNGEVGTVVNAASAASSLFLSIDKCMSSSVEFSHMRKSCIHFNVLAIIAGGIVNCLAVGCLSCLDLP